MTETTAPPPLDGTDSRRLTRNDDRVVGGVCAALGRYTNVDPVIYRVSLAVLTIFGGLGVALYLLGWLLIPEEGEPESAAERFFHKHRDTRVWWIVGAGVLLLILFSALDDGHGAFPALVIAGLVIYLVRRERGPFPVAQAVTEAPPGWTPPPQQDSRQWQPPVPKLRRPKRERSKLGLVTLSLAVMVTGFLLALRFSGADGLDADRIMAAALMVLGGGLLVGAWYGRARWLIAVAGLLSTVLIPVSLVTVPFSAGMGERYWLATSAGAGQYRLGIGDASLVIVSSQVTPTRVEASVGVGHLLVIVPDNVRVEVVATADIGQVMVFGQTDAGTHVGYDREPIVAGPPDGPLVRLEAKVGIGQVEVRYEF